MAKSSKRVVVNEKYFNLIKRKSELLDEAFFCSGDNGLTVTTEMIKECNKIDKQWQRLEWDVAEDVEPYVEPSPEKKKDEPKQDKPKSSKKTKRS